MLKKFILPIGAIAAISLTACSGSANVKVQAETGSAENSSVSVSAAGGSSATEPTDEEIAAALAARQAALAASPENGSSKKRGFLSAGRPEEPMPATCEMLVDNENEVQAKFDVKDKAIVTMGFSVVDEAIKSIMTATFKENISQDEINDECELTKGENNGEGATVTCEGNTISVAEVSTELPPAMFAMVASTIKESCVNTQQTGFMGGTAPSAPAAAPEALKVDCNVDMNANEWNVNVNGINMKYIFEGNRAKMITEMAQDMGSAEMCQMAITMAKQEDASVNGHCDGTVLKMQAVEDTDETKAELYERMKPFCPAK